MNSEKAVREHKKITFSQYQTIKCAALGLAINSGVSMHDSELDYQTQFLLSRTTVAENGPFLRNWSRIQVAYREAPLLHFESLLLDIRVDGIGIEKLSCIYARKIGLTVIDQAVRYAWKTEQYATALPTPTQAQPVTALDPDTRSHFDTWEFELRDRHDFGLYELGVTIQEFEEITALVDQDLA